MIKWKQRLYAFLLRRTLGPFLDAASQQKLHESIDVSFQEGTFTLNNVGLSASYLNNKLNTNESSNDGNGAAVVIQKASVLSITIQLSLVEGEQHRDANSRNGGDGDDTANSASRISSSSLAWRAFTLGSSVSLVAHVEIDGIELVVEPLVKSGKLQATHTMSNNDGKYQHNASSVEEEIPPTKSTLAAYMEAALASLQLSLSLKNLSVRLCQPARQQQSTTTWVELRLPSFSYQDLDSSSMSPSSSSTAATSPMTDSPKISRNRKNYRTILEKSILFQGITLVAGETTASIDSDGNHFESSRFVSTMALAEGTGHVILRAVEYQGGSSGKSSTTTNSRATNGKVVQQDIQVRLNQQLKVSVDETSLLQVHSILEGFNTSGTEILVEQPLPVVDDESENGAPDNVSGIASKNSGVDEMELYTLDGIMKHYQEARKLAERNEMRGGILVPSNAYEDAGHIGEGDSKTFDIFFDANEKSFSHYASMMKDSIIASQTGEASSDFIHTKLRLHLLGGGFKLSFRNRKSDAQSMLGPDEYILATFNDLDVTSSVSSKRIDYVVNVGRFEVDDAQIPYNSDVTQGRRVEIGNLMSFAESAIDDDAVGGGDVLVQPSCISVQIGIETNASDKSKRCDFELNLKPIEMVYRRRTLSHITSMVDTLKRNKEPVASHNVEISTLQDESNNQIASAFCTLASLTLILPVLEDRDFSSLYRRCGHFADASGSNRSAIGVLFENLTFEHKRQNDTVEESEAPIQRVATTLDCHNIICFASSPESTGNSLGRLCHRLDFFAATGRFEVDPFIPITVAYRQNLQGGPSDSNVGREAFPSVPTLSSFKARQEDEDEDDEIDRILSEKLQDVNVDSRRALRAKDPQTTMVTEAENCEVVVMVHIPAIVVDSSRIELEALLEMIQCIMPKEKNAPSPGKPSSSPPASSSVAVSLACDSVRLAVHNYEIIRDRPRWNSFLFRFDRCRAHTIPGNTPTQSFRFLSHEATLYEVQDLVECCELIRAPFEARDRVRTMIGRSSRTERSTSCPLIYRSKLMPAISHGSPSFLLDIIEPVDENERSIFVSLYNITHRYKPDSAWMERFVAVFKDLGQKDGASHQSDLSQIGGHAKATEMVDSETSTFLTRGFLSIADCSLDYTSLGQFSTASRSIVSIGDLRLSSNIVHPAMGVQAFSLSLGDVSYYLCNTRFPHNYENSLLPGASHILPPEELSVPSHHHRNVQEMGFKTIITLESLDAIIAKTNSRTQSTPPNKPKRMEPQVTVSLTLGELSLYACQDCFDCFVNSVGELQTKVTALNDEAFEALRHSLSQGEIFLDAQSELGTSNTVPETTSESLKSAANHCVETVPVDARDHYLLDGYDWTTIDHEPGFEGGIPAGEEQVARWYHKPNTSSHLSSSANGNDDQLAQSTSSLRIISQHFPLQVVSDPLGGGDMGASRFSATDSVEVGARILLHDMKFKCRLFDGYDWPELQTERKRSRHALFVIDKSGIEQSEGAGNAGKGKSGPGQERKSEFLGGLLSGAPDNSATFGDLPLPEERMKSFLTQNELRRLSRRTNSYVQFFADGISLRLDSFCDSSEHRLKSCLDLAIKDFFLAETISSPTPVKMIGEWFNEVEHPRDSNDGLLMLKLVTWKPMQPVTEDGKIASEECEVALTLSPMRCIIDQRAIKFTKAYFNKGGGEDEGSSAAVDDWTAGLHLIPPPFLRIFRMQPVKLKIDYWPQTIDTAALKNGSVVELINLSPLDAMVLTLHRVEIENVVGFGEAAGGLVSHWLGDICATQMYKFLTNARPFEPVTNIGGGFVDLFVLPWDAYKNGEKVSRALRSSVSSLVGTVAHETLTTSSRITAFFAGEMARATTSPHGHGPMSTTTTANSSLPSRPLGTPRRIGDTAGHALESLARGVQTSNYKMIIVPYREYRRSGARGAVKSFVRGIPVAVAAPVSGASEALSYTLLGARNQIRPDIRKEEEVSQRGLHYGGL